MPKVLTKKTALFLSATSTPPTIPAGFIEVADELVLTPTIAQEEYSVVNGMLGAWDTMIDTCDNTVTPSITHRMRTSNIAGTALETPPPYATLLKIGGFSETITGTGATGVVTYKNSQAPASGSAHFYIDGYKQTATGGVAADLSFDFTVGKVATITGTLSAFLDNNGVATVQAAPTIPTSTEKLLMVACTDIVTAGGGTLKADKVTIAMGSEVTRTYAMGEKSFDVSDYKIMITASFMPENADYNALINKLNAQTVEAIDIKLNTTTGGALVDGKSVNIKVSLAKVTNYEDAAENKKLKRTVTWLAQGDSAGQIIEIIHGNFA
jgi:hypothetical protein